MSMFPGFAYQSSINELLTYLIGLSPLVWLGMVAGMLHMAAPDHWVPASIYVWQKGASRIQVLMLVTTFHVALGVLLYLMMRPIFIGLSEHFLFFAIVLILFVMVLRAFRFRRIYEVQRSGSRGIWGFPVLLSLAGPSELLIPILIRIEQKGALISDGILFFWIGSMLGGLALVSVAIVRWRRPIFFPRDLVWATSFRPVLPVFVLVTASLFLLKLF